MNDSGVVNTVSAAAFESPSYGLWLVVVLNAAIFIAFAFSFFRPRTRRDWRTFGTFSAFVVALFAEMYGFPLTIYLLSGWLTSRNPNLDLFAHDSGHLWSTILRLDGDPHFSLLHLLSNGLILVGFVLLGAAWRVLYQAQRSGTLATTGPYSHLRHPQYVAFTLIMAGFLVQWPTLPTLLMFPILLATYLRLARREEREARATFGDAYARYAAQTPAFVPHHRWLRMLGSPRDEHLTEEAIAGTPAVKTVKTQAADSRKGSALGLPRSLLGGRRESGNEQVVDRPWNARTW
jgi:protein-S-isoprenylcysteine O-methyltransferase Ste14